MRHIAWSPDGSYFVVAATGGYHGGSLEDCDSASRFDASSTGQDVKPAWVDFTGTDSLYSVAVTSDAVYVGGHQRWLNNPYGQDNPQRAPCRVRGWRRSTRPTACRCRGTRT